MSFPGRHRFVSLLLATFILVPGISISGTSCAQIVQQLQLFTFGTIAIRSNAAIERLNLNLNGTFSSTANILVVSPPRRAEFLVSGLPASTALSLSIASIQLGDGSASSKKFDVVFVYLANMSTDSTGSVTISIGGSLKTSGDGTAYTDNAYGATASLIVNY